MKEGIDYELVKTEDDDGNVIKTRVKMLKKTKITSNPKEDE